jgi:hypothetical protein
LPRFGRQDEELLKLFPAGRKRMKIPPAMSKRIEEEVAKLLPEPIGHINYEGIRHRGLPLFGTIGEVWLLRADGSFWKVDSDFGRELEPLPENLQTIALAAGKERYPWLADLLPSRPDIAITCSDCGGRGRFGPGNILYCHSCGALGWRTIG